MPCEFPEVPELSLARPISLLPPEAVPSGSMLTKDGDSERADIAHLELQKQAGQRPDADVSLPDTCNRRLAEFCCGENSLLGAEAYTPFKRLRLCASDTEV